MKRNGLHSTRAAEFEPRMLGRYQLVKPLGAGGMGVVYAGYDSLLKRLVAIKALTDTDAASAARRQRLVREGEALAQVRHPHVVVLHDIDTAEGSPFLVMELLDGTDLETWLRDRGPMSSQAVADLAVPLCAALATCHARGVVHRDVKLSNLVVDGRPGGRTVTLCDFGIAQIQGVAAGDERLGSWHSMAPELFGHDDTATPESDQFSLGVALFQCLTRRLPFPARDVREHVARTVDDAPLPLCALSPGVPAPLAEAVHRMLRVEPAARFASMWHVADALLRFASPATRATWEAPVREGLAGAATDEYDDRPSGVVRRPTIAPTVARGPTRATQALAFALVVLSATAAFLVTLVVAHREPRPVVVVVRDAHGRRVTR